jgi:CO/xanthine dehydrogenase FAD-binding subunit
MALQLLTCPDAAAAQAALAQPRTRLIAGGTMIVRQANDGDVSFGILVRNAAPENRSIAVTGGIVRIGAGVTVAEIASHPALTPLAGAARSVGGPAVRNMATIGGNLFAPAPYGDLAVALIALGADAELANGERLPVEALIARRTSPPPTTVVAAICFPAIALDQLRFLKISRVHPRGLSVVTLAVTLTVVDGLVATARVAFSGMADHPVAAPRVAAALVGQPLTADGIAAALVVATQGFTPPSDAIASGWYRAAVLPVHLLRLLLGR